MTMTTGDPLRFQSPTTMQFVSMRTVRYHDPDMQCNVCGETWIATGDERCPFCESLDISSNAGAHEAETVV